MKIVITVMSDENRKSIISDKYSKSSGKWQKQ